MHDDWQKAIDKAENRSQKKSNTDPDAAATVAVTPGPGTANGPQGKDVHNAPSQSEDPDIPRRLYCDKCLHIADSPKGVVSGNNNEMIISTSNQNCSTD